MPPVPARPRPTTGGKGLPRKTAPAPAAHAAIPDFSAPAKSKTKKANAAVKKVPKAAGPGKKKAPPVPQGKFKSAEIIEDSEEEYDLGTSEVGGQEDDADADEDEDDFAKMLGESLAEGADGVGEEDDDEEEEEEDDEYDEVLEGARFAPRQSKSSASESQAACRLLLGPSADR